MPFAASDQPPAADAGAARVPAHISSAPRNTRSSRPGCKAGGSLVVGSVSVLVRVASPPGSAEVHDSAVIGASCASGRGSVPSRS